MEMKNRKCYTTLTETEYGRIKAEAGRAAVPLSLYIRQCILGNEKTSMIFTDLPVLIREVRRVGNGISRLLDEAERKGMPEADELREALLENRAADRLIFDTFS